MFPLIEHRARCSDRARCGICLTLGQPTVTIHSTYHSGEKPERLQVLQDVARLGRDEQHVQLLHRLVHVPHRLSLHEGVLLRRGLGRRRRRSHEFGECGEQALDARLRHLDELPREQRLAGLGADGRGQQDLKDEEFAICTAKKAMQSFAIHHLGHSFSAFSL